MSDPGYNFLDRLLHRLALHFNTIAEISFDLDQKLVQFEQDDITSQRHVFISGLARSGTTILMRRFHATGIYRSLTYRDMPFVLAPNLWRRLSSISKRDIESAERAHGDSLLVNADSPESLDEVFWRIFVGDEYLEKSHLKPHDPSDEIIHKYVSYINAILSAHSPQGKRYLSKNNNNILRLAAIHRAFPNALILIPFRDPFQHALSLFRQHRHFSELQATSKFTLSYMTWLGHHEFGLDHRPFLFDDTGASQYPTDTIDYWLQLWCQAYERLEKSRSESALFVCYEDLCEDEECWSRLAALADIPVEHKTGETFKLSTRPVEADFNQDLTESASAIYTRLVTQSRRQLY